MCIRFNLPPKAGWLAGLLLDVLRAIKKPGNRLRFQLQVPFKTAYSYWAREGRDASYEGNCR